MAKSLSAKEQRQQLNQLFAQQNKRLGKLYASFVRKMASLGYDDSVLQSDALFNFDNFPEYRQRLNDIFADYYQNSILNYKAGITDGVTLAYAHDAAALTGFSVLSNKALRVARETAAETFISHRLNSTKGLNLAQTVWNYCQQTKSEFEMAMANVLADGLKAGTSAETIGRKVRQYLNNPDMMYRRYHTVKVLKNGTKKDVVTWRRKRIIDGKVRFVEEPLEKVGMGVYRSSRMNALRVARTEINAAYHKARNERWKNEPFVIGQWIHVSPQHAIDDICNDLEDRYPKDFDWAGWHPNCYAEGTRVLTRAGWKEFKNVSLKDKILSLNPVTRTMEYTSIEQKQVYHYEGELIQFHNRSLDCLVTPEHQMVYQKKYDTSKIARCAATEYGVGKGGFYRGAEYFAPDKEDVLLGDKIISFDLFCEFMGYYLADGSMMRDYGIVLSQKKGEPAFDKMVACITKLGYEPHIGKETIVFYHRAFGRNLLKFGKAADKYVPQEILTASKRQIQIFLDAFVLCDGSKRAPKSFIGSHGHKFVSTNEERCYYTTSKQLAADLGVLLLQTDKRPSYSEASPHATTKKDGTIIYSRLTCYIIRECRSKTATVFSKERVPYKGQVYDLTLAKNHIMYIQYNGKCFWGSNCICTSDPIMIQGDEKDEFYRRLYAGEDMSNFHSVFEIKEMPDSYNQYIRDNADAIVRAAKKDKLAWHLADNKKYWVNLLTDEQRAEAGLKAFVSKKTASEKIAEAAKLRHANRDEKRIQSAWSARRRRLYNEKIDSIIGANTYLSDLPYSLKNRYYDLRDAIEKNESVSNVEKLFKRFERGYNVYKEWDTTRVIREGKYLYSTLADYPAIDRALLGKAISSADNANIRVLVDKLAPRLRFEEQITPQILKDSVMRKKYGDAAVDALYSNTARTMKKYEALSTEERIKKYRFEKDWVLANRSFSTVKEVAAYYEREAVRLERVRDFRSAQRAIVDAEKKLAKYGYKSALKGTEYYDQLATLQKEQKALQTLAAKVERIDKIADYSATSRSTILRAYKADIDAALAKNGIRADVDSLLTKAEKKIAELERAKRGTDSPVTIADIKAKMGTATPKTLENLQSLIDERMKSDFASLTDSQIKKYKEQMLHLFDHSDFGMNVPRIDRKGNNVIESIFNSYFKAQQETGTGKGLVDISTRNIASEKLFGTNIAKAKPKEYEKYGFLMDKDILAQSKSRIASQYWSGGDGIQIRFKKDKVIATYTAEDSLSIGRIPALTTDPMPTSASFSKVHKTITGKPINSAIQATKEWAYSYFELQFHGDLTLDCIESIFVPKDVVPKLGDKLLSKMARYGKIWTEQSGKLVEWVAP